MTNTVFKRLLLPALLLALVTSFLHLLQRKQQLRGITALTLQVQWDIGKIVVQTRQSYLKVKMKRIISLRSIKVKEFMSEVRIISNILG